MTWCSRWRWQPGTARTMTRGSSTRSRRTCADNWEGRHDESAHRRAMPRGGSEARQQGAGSTQQMVTGGSEMTLKMIDGSARELKEVRCPACGKLLCKVRILRGDAVLVESVCTRSWCRKAVAVEVQERPAA